MNTEACCRICLEENYAIFHVQELSGDSTIAELILKICPDVTLDHKPHNICANCLHQLKLCIQFKIRCETSDQFLKNINFDRKCYDGGEDEDIDDFIDTNLFDQNYFLDPDYANDPTDDDLKPDFDNLETRMSTDDKVDSKATQVAVDNNDLPIIDRKKHQRMSSRSIVCQICSERFSGPTKLIQHSREVHHDNHPFKCPHTNCTRKYMIAKALKVHLRLHDVKKAFQCEECNAGFHVKANLMTHLRTHTGDKAFKCSYPGCDKAFSSSSYFKQHQIKHLHGENLPRPFACDYEGCEKTFTDKNCLRSHSLVHEATKNFKCEICSSRFRLKQSLKIHKLKHTNIKQYTCHVCGIAFKYRSQCYDHVRAHSANRELECFHCGKKFVKKSLLAMHMQTHLSSREYTCSECKKSFKTYNCLYSHRAIHKARVAKYSCASCDKTFRTRPDLTNHERVHTCERPWSCHIKSCKKTFKFKSNLNIHVRSHYETSFDCDLCGKTVANSNSLRVHLNKVHQAEKKFACSDCTMRFASIQLLKIHSEMHRPKQFSCNLCNQRYNFEADLRRHEVKMHQGHAEIVQK